jgi:hypothetical protein
MRFLLPDPLGNNKHPQMFHTTALAIGAGVVAVAAAGTSAAISMSAADRAKKAQGAAAGKFQKQQRKASQAFEQSQEKALGDYRGAVTAYQEGERVPYQMIQDVQAPEYNLGAMVGDAGQITDYNIQQGQKISDYNLAQGVKISDYYRQQLENFQPGAAAIRRRSVDQLNRAMDVTDQYLRGEIPQDVREQTMRNIAEFGGAGFNPATAGRAGGFQTAQALVPRQFGLTSLDLQRQALGAIPSIQGTAQNWQQLARAFTADVRAADVQAASPLDVGRLQLGYQTAIAEVGLQKGRALSGINQGIFGASTNFYNAQQDVSKNIFAANSGLADKIYGAQKENIAASYAAQQAVGQGVSQIGQATSGALMGVSGAYGQMGAAGAGGTTYGSYAAAQQAAPYAGSISQTQGMGYVPRASAV